MFFEFVLIFFCFFIFCFLGLFLYFFSYFLILKNLNFEKNMPYECGFTPFEDTRGVFNVEFYLVSILFVIFDLEIMFLFPWVLVISCLNFFGIFTMIFFLFLLILVFFYEILQGILDW